MLSWWECALRVLFAMALGALIGWERESKGKPAGLRTLSLVSVASGLFVLAAQQAALRSGEPVDSVRAMTGVAQGVGFLGAGVILQGKKEVRWLTTATSLWAAAAVGFCAGLGMYVLGIIGAAVTYATLCWFKPIESRLVEGTQGNDSDGDEE